jgi:hypothetical protein
METEQNDFVEVKTGVHGARVTVPRVPRIRYFTSHWSNYVRGQEQVVLSHHWVLRVAMLKELSKETDLRAEVVKKYPQLADDAAWNEAIEALSSRGLLVREMGPPHHKDPDGRRIPTGRFLISGNGAFYGAMPPHTLGLEE